MKFRKSSPSLIIGAWLLLLFLVSCGVPATPTPLPPTATPTPIPPTATPLPTATPILTTGRIEGKVFRSDTGKSIANATVSLDDATLDPKDPKFKVSETTTDVQGRYSFADVKPGRYSMSVTWLFQNQSDSPCPGVGMTRDGWLVIVGVRKDGGLVLVATGVEQKFTVAAGETLRRDIDLSCK